MIPTNRIPAHPGVILRTEFLEPAGISQVDLAGHIGIPLNRVNEIVNGKRGVSTETAVLLGKSLGTTPEFWLNLQNAHDLARHRDAGSEVIDLLETLRARVLASRNRAATRKHPHAHQYAAKKKAARPHVKRATR